MERVYIKLDGNLIPVSLDVVSGSIYQDIFKQLQQISTQVEIILEQKNILYYQKTNQVVIK